MKEFTVYIEPDELELTQKKAEFFGMKVELIGKSKRGKHLNIKFTHENGYEIPISSIFHCASTIGFEEGFAVAKKLYE